MPGFVEMSKGCFGGEEIMISSYFLLFNEYDRRALTSISHKRLFCIAGVEKEYCDLAG